MNQILRSVQNMFRMQDLRNRVLFTLALLAVYRIGAHIPTPGINCRVVQINFSNRPPARSSEFSICSAAEISAA